MFDEYNLPKTYQFYEDTQLNNTLKALRSAIDELKKEIKEIQCNLHETNWAIAALEHKTGFITVESSPYNPYRD
jgi:hypothetical protein